MKPVSEHGPSSIFASIPDFVWQVTTGVSDYYNSVVGSPSTFTGNCPHHMVSPLNPLNESS